MDQSTASFVGQDFVTIRGREKKVLCVPRGAIRAMTREPSRVGEVCVVTIMVPGSPPDGSQVYVSVEEYERLAALLSLEGVMRQVFDVTMTMTKALKV